MSVGDIFDNIGAGVVSGVGFIGRLIGKAFAWVWEKCTAWAQSLMMQIVVMGVAFLLIMSVLGGIYFFGVALRSPEEVTKQLANPLESSYVKVAPLGTGTARTDTSWKNGVLTTKLLFGVPSAEMEKLVRAHPDGEFVVKWVRPKDKSTLLEVRIPASKFVMNDGRFYDDAKRDVVVTPLLSGSADAACSRALYDEICEVRQDWLLEWHPGDTKKTK